jgi:ferredoxin
MEPTGERYRLNSWGPFYVTDGCDGCGICAEFAPDNFVPNWDATYYAVAQQPQTTDEVRAVRQAMDACPRQCIGDDWEN